MTFQRGQSGNPGGRAKGLTEVRDLARKHTAEPLKALIDIATTDQSEAARVAAANALLDRAWGKPAQTIHATHPEDRDVAELTDAELAAIIARGDGTAAAPRALRPARSGKLH